MQDLCFRSIDIKHANNVMDMVSFYVIYLIHLIASGITPTVELAKSFGLIEMGPTNG
jgi:hypothetical protein